MRTLVGTQLILSEKARMKPGRWAPIRKPHMAKWTVFCFSGNYYAKCEIKDVLSVLHWLFMLAAMAVKHICKCWTVNHRTAQLDLQTGRRVHRAVQTKDAVFRSVVVLPIPPRTVMRRRESDPRSVLCGILNIAPGQTCSLMLQPPPHYVISCHGAKQGDFKQSQEDFGFWLWLSLGKPEF